jgi:hypothetical protein
MAIMIFMLAVVVWLTVATIIMGTSSVGSNHYSVAFFIAIFQFIYWVPAIAAAAISEFAFSFLPVKWRALAYLLFSLSCLAVLARTVGLFHKPGTENYAVLVYPTVAVGMLYIVRSLTRQPA